MGKIRVLLADDHTMLRAALAALINKQVDMEVVGEASDCRETLELTSALLPDVLVLDLNMPGVGGMKIIEKLRKDGIPSRILVLTMHDDPAYLHAARALGCMGYISKTDALTDLLEGIRLVQQGRIYISKRLLTLLEHMEAPPSVPTGSLAPNRAPADQLTARERQVLQMLAQGYSYQRIAEELFLSVKTIETYRTRIGQKLDFRSRADLVRYALETGLLNASGSARKAAPVEQVNGVEKNAHAELPPSTE